MIFSESAFYEWDTCERAFAYSRLLKVRPTTGPDDLPARLDGIAVHTMLAAHYAGKDPYAPMEQLYREQVPEGWEEIYAPWVEERIEYMRRLMDAYLRRYQEEPWRRVLLIEAWFGMALHARCPGCGKGLPQGLRVIKRRVLEDGEIPECPWCGREIDHVVGVIDLAVEYPGGEVVVIDHKTTERYTARQLESVPYSPQVLTYLRGAELLLGRSVNRVQVNVITLLKHIDKRGNPFHRSPVRFVSPDERATHIVERSFVIDEINARRANLGVGFPRRLNACFRQGRCVYFPLCHPPREQWWLIPATALFEGREQ